MPKFDLSKTSELFALCSIGRNQRDQAWVEKFYAAVVDASMVTTPAQIIAGPDGFGYFVLELPPPYEAITPFCISHILDYCLEGGIGVVINPSKAEPDWVFPYGKLWSLKETGCFDPPAIDSDNPTPRDRTVVGDAPQGKVYREIVKTDEKAFIGAPSEKFFPDYAKNVMRPVIKRIPAMKDREPQVLLIAQPDQSPVLSFVFNIFREDFETEEEYVGIIYRMRWYLPSNVGITSFSKDSDICRHFRSF
jgi:hypothetical protein